ncbi:hypothetical protein JCM6882_007248 [Rhodosporidiobolus microsporus]
MPAIKTEKTTTRARYAAYPAKEERSALRSRFRLTVSTTDVSTSSTSSAPQPILTLSRKTVQIKRNRKRTAVAAFGSEPVAVVVVSSSTGRKSFLRATRSLRSTKGAASRDIPLARQRSEDSMDLDIPPLEASAPLANFYTTLESNGMIDDCGDMIMTEITDTTRADVEMDDAAPTVNEPRTSTATPAAPSPTLLPFPTAGPFPSTPLRPFTPAVSVAPVSEPLRRHRRNLSGAIKISKAAQSASKAAAQSAEKATLDALFQTPSKPKSTSRTRRDSATYPVSPVTPPPAYTSPKRSSPPSTAPSAHATVPRRISHPLPPKPQNYYPVIDEKVPFPFGSRRPESGSRNNRRGGAAPHFSGPRNSPATSSLTPFAAPPSFPRSFRPAAVC